MHPFDEFKSQAPKLAPGVLVLFDIADAKRLNCHVGHEDVDQAIKDFSKAIESAAKKSGGLAKRIEGDKWMALLKADASEHIERLLSSFYKDQKVEIGWRMKGIKDGELKTQERKELTTLTWAMRCMYTKLHKSKDVENSIDELLDQNWGVEPNVAVELLSVEAVRRGQWSCVGKYPEQQPFCPHCGGVDFDWEEGGFGVYDGCGTCNTCGASISESDA